MYQRVNPKNERVVDCASCRDTLIFNNLPIFAGNRHESGQPAEHERNSAMDLRAGHGQNGVPIHDGHLGQAVRHEWGWQCEFERGARGLWPNAGSIQKICAARTHFEGTG